MAGLVVSDLGDGEGNVELGVVLVVLLEVAIEFIVLRVVEERDPLLVLLVLLDGVVQEVLLERNTDRAKELVVVLILNDNTDDFLRFGAPEGHHDGVRLFEVGAVDELHVSVSVEAHFFFVLVVELTWLEVNVVNMHVELVPEIVLSTSYPTRITRVNGVGEETYFAS